MVSGKYFHHKKARPFNKIASNDGLQEQFLNECKNVIGIVFPEQFEGGNDF
jgi:hypothetical protein